ncbi:acetylornithine aminotransferase [Desulfonatronum thiosulfatophilum]|uniref:Acetylornithine aminotransferase n=1 Tax=Desulfonatronum thiosulfatophilum TaxID=617002 RepID=A0A1G6E1J4_9BACT|nr:aspartate aminotransferase family protein [Desulfonatronum thiosulfatophilum]SDB51256.1 acetylornithine aminotransferase [Desulfonatronum thiosulfatophilum]
MTPSLANYQEREQRVLCHTYGRYPLAVTRASGCKLYDPQGREYLDLLAGIAVCNLGHSHPELLAVMREQAERLIHVSNLFHQDEQLVLAEKLLATCSLDKVFFCNSGAEANEAGIKLARRYMQKVKGRDAYEIISLAGSFHGRTLATLTATGQDKVKDGFAPLPEGFQNIPFGDFPALEQAVSQKTAGILLEIIQGEGGVRPLENSYLLAVQELCRDRGILLMVDEVQTGLGRSGKFWAHEHAAISPDILTTAKALANGLPMGAMLCTAETSQGFVPGSHATTFGGGPLVAAVAARVVDILLRDDFAQRAETIGNIAQGMFRELQALHPGKIVDVRGRGLMLGIELAFPGQEVWRELLESGFVLNLTQDRVLRLLPPLVVTEEDLARFSQALGDILKKK